MMENHDSKCARCGAVLSEDAAGGLCPRCLMAMNFESRTMPEGEEPPRMPTLSPEELAEKFPQYEILECLGRGGMGVVYKARQKSLNRVVAIKILAPERENEARFAERFAREAELLAKLNHPHIVTIHDFGVSDSQPSTLDSQPLYFLVMEFVDGVNLRDLLRDGKLEPEQALAIVPPICDALQYAHDKGIVHRDIKPENLLLDRDGRIKIADFGIASLIGVSGENAGTPPYMAPEQTGISPEVDHRADIYALGVVLYEMLTGERPNKEVIAPSRKVQLDVRIDEMVLRALEKNPELRYQTAGEFRTVVETMAGLPLPRTATAASTNSALGLTLILHGSLVVLVIALMFFVVPPWIGLMREFEAPLPAITRNIIDLRRIRVIQSLLLLFVLDVACCYVARMLGGRRGLRLWSISAITGLTFIVAIVGAALSLPLQKLIGDLGMGAQVRAGSGATNETRAFGPALERVVNEMEPARQLDKDAAALQIIEAGKAIGDANEYLDLELAVIDANVAGMGEKHPAVIVTKRALARFKEAHPAMPDAICKRLAKERRDKMLEELAHMFDSGLGKVHPVVLALQARIDAFAELAAKAEKPAEAAKPPPANKSDQIAVEDLALHMIVAIREKDDDKLRSMATDRIKGWRDALPVFAIELREHYRQSTGNEAFDLRAGESLIEGDLAAVRCTGPAVLEGKCLVLFFVKTNDGWRNHSLRASTESTPLATHMADFKKEIEKE